MKIEKAADKGHRETTHVKLRTLWRVGVTVAVVLPLSFVWSAAPANADSDNICNYYPGNNCEYNNATIVTNTTHTGDASSNGTGAVAYYLRTDDILKARDASSDGHSAVVYWELYKNGDQVRRGYCRNQQGSGTTRGCNKYFAAGSGTLCIQAIEYDGGSNQIIRDELAAHVPCFTM